MNNMTTKLIIVLLGIVLSSAKPGIADAPNQAEISSFLSGVSSFVKEERQDATHEVNFDPKGFWPTAEQLATAEKLDSKLAEYYQGWMTRVLNESLLSEDRKVDHSEWFMIPQPPVKRASENGNDKIESVYLVAGRMQTRNVKVNGIEFQALTNRHEIALTILSEKTFPNKKITKSEVLEALREFLNIPQERFAHLDLTMTSTVIGDDQTNFAHGKIFDRRHKHPEYDHPELLTKIPAGLPPGKYYKSVPLIPEEKREWFSPMEYWIAKGRLVITFSTVDWKNPNRPM